MKMCILVYILEITANCCNIDFYKTYAIFGVNSFSLEIMWRKICDIENVCLPAEQGWVSKILPQSPRVEGQVFTDPTKLC